MKWLLLFLLLGVFGDKSEVVHIKSDGLPIKKRPMKDRMDDDFAGKEVYKIISKRVI